MSFIPLSYNSQHDRTEIRSAHVVLHGERGIRPLLVAIDNMMAETL